MRSSCPRQASEPLPWTVDDEQATISINYTSGTTGDPKGVAYTHRGAYLNSLGEVIHSAAPRAVGVPLDAADVPLQRLVHHRGRVTAVGGTHVCLRAVAADVIWPLIDEEGVTHLNGAPAVMTSSRRAPEAHRLRAAGDGDDRGAPPSPTMIAEMEAHGARVGSRLRADRGLRADTGVRMAAGLDRPGSAERPESSRARASGW